MSFCVEISSRSYLSKLCMFHKRIILTLPKFRQHKPHLVYAPTAPKVSFQKKECLHVNRTLNKYTCFSCIERPKFLFKCWTYDGENPVYVLTNFFLKKKTQKAYVLGVKYKYKSRNLRCLTTLLSLHMHFFSLRPICRLIVYAPAAALKSFLPKKR